MTPLELAEGEVRGSAFLESLAGRPVTIIGSAFNAGPAVRILDPTGAALRVEPLTTRADLTRDALVVVTGSAALRELAVIAARSAGVPVLSDLDLLWLARNIEAFAITGASSTSAAARLAATVLATTGRSVLVASDDASADVDADLLIVQPSVDALAAVQVFRPRVAVVLRGAPALAARLTAHQTVRDCVVVGADDPALATIARSTRAHVVLLSTTHALDHGVYVARGWMTSRLNNRVEDICPVDGIPTTDLEAALAAVACALWAGLDPAIIGEAMRRRFSAERSADAAVAVPAAGHTSLPERAEAWARGLRGLVTPVRALLSRVRRAT